MRRRIFIAVAVVALGSAAVPVAFAFFSATKTSPQPISVAAAPVTTTITVPAAGFVDYSGAVTPTDVSPATALNDDRLFPEADGFRDANFTTSFATDRFYEWDYGSPLPPGQPASGVDFDFRFESDRGNEVACFYFDVFNSAGTKIGTHGSKTPGNANSPWCTDSDEKLVSTSLPEVTTTTIANGLQIRVYGTESNRKPIRVDQATISGTTTGNQNFTLYAATGVNQADKTQETRPWPLALEDSVFDVVDKAWNSNFNNNRFLLYVFPSGVVPGSAAIDSVSFLHRYQPDSGSTVCFYLNVIASSGSLGTVPDPPGTNGASCATGTQSWVSDSIAIPMLDTPAKVNGVALRLIYRTAERGDAKSREDYGALRITYH